MTNHPTGFDPHNVKRFLLVDHHSCWAVDSSAYDELLKLYDELEIEKRVQYESLDKAVRYEYARAEAAEAKLTTGGWISVEQELPKEGQENRVQLYLGNLKYPHEPYVLWGYYEREKWQTQWGEFDGDETPSHWQPMATPPAELAEKEKGTTNDQP